MSYVEICKKHGQYHGDYCGECIEDMEKELEITRDMLDSSDLQNQKLTKENARLREALVRISTWFPNAKDKMETVDNLQEVARAALEEDKK